MAVVRARIADIPIVLSSATPSVETMVNARRGRYRRLAESFFADDRRLAVRRMVWGYALSLLSTVVFYGCYAMIVAATVRGRLSLGDMTLYLVAFRQGQQSFQAVLSVRNRLVQSYTDIMNMQV